MATGVVPGALVVSSADQLPLPPPPGVVVVTSLHADRTADDLVGALGAGSVLGPVEALAELARRRQADVGGPRERAHQCRAAAATAWSEVEAARAACAGGMSGLDPATVRRAALAVAGALEAVETAKATLGTRPRLDEVAASAAHQADADMELARRQRYAGLPQANSVLTAANGAAAALVAARLVSEAFDPAFFLVAVLPLGALGFTTHTVVANIRRSRAAARRRWAALRSLDVCTMAGLAALEARTRAWLDRDSRLTAAQDELGRAKRAWEVIVGHDVAVGDAGRLAAKLESVVDLEARVRAAEAAWTEAVVELQQAEDLAGSGYPPLVVLNDRTTGRPIARRRAMKDLVGSAGPARIVVVEPEAVRADPSAQAPEGGAIVDLAERVLAGVQRLRTKAARSHRPPPGSVAAGG